MQTIQKFSAWFSSQKLVVKSAFGCLILFVLCCLCSITVFILIPTTPPTAENTPIAETELLPTSTQTEKPVEIFTATLTIESELTDTPLPPTILTPTNTSVPPTVTPTLQREALVDVYGILGKPVNAVEAVLGSAILITPNDDNDDALAGGEWRDYKLDKYTVMVSYDENEIARVFTVTDGLMDENYSPKQWKEILPQFGVYIKMPPERTAPMAVYWDDYQGYFIAVAGDPVWTVQIAEVEYRP